MRSPKSRPRQARTSGSNSFSPEAAPTDRVCIWRPQPGPQTALIKCPTFEVFFGGARGGGKSDGMLGEWLRHAQDYGQDAIGIMFRRELKQLTEMIERSQVLYRPLGAKYSEQAKMWRFPNGARLRFAYLERDADADAYQGHSYTRVYIEEIGTFPSERPILKLMATLRSGSGVPVGFRATGNPGGPGHQWVKVRYIDPAPGGWRTITDSQTGLERIYIPSRVADNAYLGADYVQRLRASGSDSLVRAWLEGDWSVIEGAFFPEFSLERHVLRPFAVPRDWLRFRSMDWGSASPASIGWWAVVGDDHVVGDLSLPRGALVRYREWYVASKPGVGLKLTHDEICTGIKDRERQDPKMAYGVLDPRAFASEGGPSIAEEYARRQVHFRKADNKRVPDAGAIGGWDQVRARLVGDPDGRPMIYFFDTCRDIIRTLPALQHDAQKPEDVDTESEDHAPDECRYACMSRPYVRHEPDIRKRAPVLGVGPHNEVTMNRLFSDDELPSKRRRRI